MFGSGFRVSPFSLVQQGLCKVHSQSRGVAPVVHQRLCKQLFRRVAPPSEVGVSDSQIFFRKRCLRSLPDRQNRLLLQDAGTLRNLPSVSGKETQ